MMNNWEKQREFYDSISEGKDYYRDTYDLWDYLYSQLRNLPHDYYLDNRNESDNAVRKAFQKVNKPAGEREKEYLEADEAEMFSTLSDAALDLKNAIEKNNTQIPEPYNYAISSVLKTCDYIKDKKFKELHNQICKELFRQIEEGEELYVYLDDYDPNVEDASPYFAPFLNATEEVGEAVDYLCCSVVTKKMIEYDNLMLGMLKEKNGEKELFYSPYYASFVIPIDKNGNAKGRNYSENKNYERLLEEIRNHKGGGVWFKASYTNSGIRKNMAPYVEGYLLTSAGDEEHLDGKIELKEIYPDDDEVEKDYADLVTSGKFKDRTQIEALLKKKISKINSANVYNIGHGNFITFDDKIIYDIGVPYRGSFSTAKSDYQNTCDKIKKVKPQMVIISHWDEDHYMGAYSNEKGIFNVPWIVTGYGQKGKSNAKRIMLYLDSIDKLYMVKRAVDDPTVAGRPLVADVSVNGLVFQIYRGEGPSSKTSEVNRYGMAIRIECNNVKTLMCGDIPYRCLPDYIIDKNDYKYVVIPHHALNLTKISYAKLDSMANVDYSFICVNGGENLGNSTKKVIDGDHYINVNKKTSYSVYFTDDDKHDNYMITFRLDGKQAPIKMLKK